MKSRKWKQDRGMTKEQLQEFGDFLKEARQSLGYNTTQMSELLYVHRTSYSRWERGMHVPQADAYLIRQEVEQVLTYSKQHKKAA
ncbi:helix-turn-helix transcriptional regulator [Cytobacillus horneckiae]|uniref:multiprotein-bridging factor 1 family protein n=1 Tax=Cytobacillus horneckiae TaxID=549687 RepID=UPI0034CE98DA